MYQFYLMYVSHVKTCWNLVIVCTYWLHFEKFKIFGDNGYGTHLHAAVHINLQSLFCS